MNPEPIKPRVQLDRLKYSLQALALDGPNQLGLFPPIVCKADELALNFDNWYTSVSANSLIEMTKEQKESLASLDRKLAAMSDSENADLWTDQSLLQDPNWAEVRMLARVALESFGWEVDVPPKGLDRYV